MASVYSASFAQFASLTGTVGLEVPAGQVWVLKDIDVWADALFEGGLVQFGGYNQQVFYGFSGDGTRNGSHGHWSGRIVLQPGESFYIYVGAGTWDVSVCGYQLATP